MKIKGTLFILGFLLLIIAALFRLVIFPTPPQQANKIHVITTTYPLTYFTNQLGGNTVEVTQLIPPGVEIHSFEPKPADIFKLNNADIFIYTGDFLETWAADLLKSVNNPQLQIVKAGDQAIFIGQTKNATANFLTADPHIWLNFSNDDIIIDAIKKALIKKEPQVAAAIEQRQLTLHEKLTNLDQLYTQTLNQCASRTLLFAGHYAFGYLAQKYSLTYVATQGLSPDKEPTAQDLIALVNQIKKDKINYIFYEELTSPKIAETLARETGAQLLELNAAHNITSQQISRGEDFFTIMTRNLNNLKQGLNCQ